MTELYLNISRPRRKFKDSLGQANHFLITALIGLDYIDNNEVECPPSFSTSWNPKNKQSSIDRTRQYILNSSLAWAVDCLDSYMSICNQDPKLIDNEDLIKDFEKAKRSVNEKFIALAGYVGNFNDFNIYASIVGLAIQWRNNTIHSGGDNKIDDEHRKTLLNSADRIKELFCNLDINETLDSFDSKQNPTFKEVTSIIRGIQRFVENVDSYLISKINIIEYACSILNHHCKKYKISLESIMALSKERRNLKLANILKSYSFSDTSITDSTAKIEINNIAYSWAKQ